MSFLPASKEGGATWKVLVNGFCQVALAPQPGGGILHRPCSNHLLPAGEEGEDPTFLELYHRQRAWRANVAWQSLTEQHMQSLSTRARGGGQGEANSWIPVRPDLLEKPGRLLTTHTVVNMPVEDL